AVVRYGAVLHVEESGLLGRKVRGNPSRYLCQRLEGERVTAGLVQVHVGERSLPVGIGVRPVVAHHHVDALVVERLDPDEGCALTKGRSAGAGWGHREYVALAVQERQAYLVGLLRRCRSVRELELARVDHPPVTEATRFGAGAPTPPEGIE